MTGKRVALVLGSGGLKQLVALPVIDYLDRNGYELAGLVGTSGGALIAALRAFGHSAPDIEAGTRRIWRSSLFGPIRPRSLLGLLGIPGGRWGPGEGLIDGRRVKAAIHEGLGDIDFAELPTRLICMATDLETGEPVALTKGRVAGAVYASLAQPPLLPAANLDGRLLVDGGYTESIAVERAFAFEPDAIISFTTEERPRPDVRFSERYANLLTRVNSELERSALANALPKFRGEMITLNTCFERRIPYWDVAAMSEIVKLGQTHIEHLRRRLGALAIA